MKTTLEDIFIEEFIVQNWRVTTLCPRDWFYTPLKTGEEFLHSLLKNKESEETIIGVKKDLLELKRIIPLVTDYHEDTDKNLKIYVCYNYLKDDNDYLFKVMNNGTTYIFSKI